MIKTIKICISILFFSTLLVSCNNNDDSSNPGEQDVFLGCCSPDPVFGENVDNLDQSAGAIIVDNLFTPNGDGINDIFSVQNIELYNNHTVTIYDNNENIIFESTDYGAFPEYFPSEQQNGNLPYADGTYKYKIVVENEQTFLKSGTFCLFTNNPVLEVQNFSDCEPLADGFDPIISGN